MEVWIDPEETAASTWGGGEVEAPSDGPVPP